MSTTRDAAVDAALAEVKAVKKLVREARAHYGPIMRQIALLGKEEIDCNAETIARLVKKKTLENEAALLKDAYENPSDIVGAAIWRLRRVNGVVTTSVVTPEIAALVMTRLAQGYSLKDVAMMVGCTDGTIANLKAGRYVVSKLAPDSRIGARGRSKVPLKVVLPGAGYAFISNLIPA